MLQIKLKTKFAIFFTILICGIIGFYAYHVIEESTEQKLFAYNYHVKSLSKYISYTFRDPMSATDLKKLQNFSQMALNNDELISIYALDRSGNTLRYAELESAPMVDSKFFTLPKSEEIAIESSEKYIIIFQPIIDQELIGWLRLTFNNREQQITQAVFQDNIIDASILAILALALMFLFLHSPLRAIDRYMRFVEVIQEQPGSKVKVFRSSKELSKIGSALNDTSRKLHAQQEQLCSANDELQQLRAFVEKSPTVAIAINYRCELLFINPFGLNLLSKLNVGEKDFLVMMPPDVQDIISKCTDDDASAVDIEVQCGDHNLLWTFSSARKGIIYAFGMDITERIAAEKDAQAALVAKLSAESANHAKSSFLANMSHEIRTPLTSIIGFSESLLDSELNMDERIAAIQTIIRSGRHLQTIINDILDVSKIEAGKLDIEQIEVSPVELLKDLDSIITIQAQEKGLKFDIEYQFPIPKSIITDPVRVKQILINLCTNAIKFTQRGLVQLKVGCDIIQRKLVFEVIDQGIGMTKEQQQKLFEPFTQADSSTTRKYGGTGLGLHLSKQLTEMLGGEISVSSSIGLGTRFKVSIGTGPLTEARYLYTLPIEKVKQDIQLQNTDEKLRGEVLLVDDNINNQQLISMYLKKAGANVSIAHNGQQAVTMATRQPYNLILMDIQMPVMDGLQATQILRSQNYKGPIVALTANAMSEEMQRCKNAGCDDYLTKPVDRNRFHEMLNQYLDSEKLSKPKQEPLHSNLLQEDPDFLELVKKFIHTLPEMLEETRSAVQLADYDQAKRRAHDLKSVGGGYGYPKVTELAAKLEFELTNKNSSAVYRLLSELDVICERIQMGADSIQTTTSSIP